MPNKPAHNRMLEVEGVSLEIHDQAGKSKILSDITFSVDRGSFVSLMGPSGCGKSTLLRIIAGLETREKGTVTRYYKRLSMVFQGHAIFPWLTVEENAAFGLAMQGVPLKERTLVAHKMLEELGLRDYALSYPNQLSGGQKQRVSVARALAVSPDILLMDEPFSSLDSITAGKLKQDIERIWKKYEMTILMVNHLIDDAIELSDKVLVLSGSPGTIKEKIHIELAHPRNVRSPEFFHYVDRVKGLLE